MRPFQNDENKIKTHRHTSRMTVRFVLPYYSKECKSFIRNEIGTHIAGKRLAASVNIIGISVEAEPLPYKNTIKILKTFRRKKHTSTPVGVKDEKAPSQKAFFVIFGGFFPTENALQMPARLS